MSRRKFQITAAPDVPFQRRRVNEPEAAIVRAVDLSTRWEAPVYVRVSGPAGVDVRVNTRPLQIEIRFPGGDWWEPVLWDDAVAQLDKAVFDETAPDGPLELDDSPAIEPVPSDPTSVPAPLERLPPSSTRMYTVHPTAGADGRVVAVRRRVRGPQPALDAADELVVRYGIPVLIDVPGPEGVRIRVRAAYQPGRTVIDYLRPGGTWTGPINEDDAVVLLMTAIESVDEVAHSADALAEKRDSRERWIARNRTAWDAGLVDPPHGDARTYSNFGCHCEACTGANRLCEPEHHRKTAEHGTATRRNQGCSCGLCVAAGREDARVVANTYKKQQWYEVTFVEKVVTTRTVKIWSFSKFDARAEAAKRFDGPPDESIAVDVRRYDPKLTVRVALTQDPPPEPRSPPPNAADHGHPR